MKCVRCSSPHGVGRGMAEVPLCEACAMRSADRPCDRYEDAREIARLKERRFPVMGGPTVAWSFVAPHEAQARINHRQSLERLAQRGGLDPAELWAVVHSVRFEDAPVLEAAREWLAGVVAAEADDKREIKRLTFERDEAVASFMRLAERHHGAECGCRDDHAPDCQDCETWRRMTEQANEWKAKYESLFVQDDALKAAVESLYEQRDALLAACDAAEERLEELKDGADDGDREAICGTLGILASARLRARGGDHV